MVSIQAEVGFREMEMRDLPAVTYNDRLSYSHPWSRRVFADCLQAGNDCWVVVRDKRVIGHGILQVIADESHLLNVCIIPEFQGEGFGRMLVEHMLERAVQLKANTIFLEVRPSNPIAYRLYATLGFNEIGIRRGYYPAEKGREDAIVLAKELRLDER